MTPDRETTVGGYDFFFASSTWFSKKCGASGVDTPKACGMRRRSTSRDPVRTLGSGFEKNRALRGSAHHGHIPGTPPEHEAEAIKPKSPPHNEVAEAEPILPVLAPLDVRAADLPATDPPEAADVAEPDPVASPARSKIPLAPGSAKLARTPLRQSPGSKLPTPRRIQHGTANSPIGRGRHGRHTRQLMPLGIGPEGWGRATGGAMDKEPRFHLRPQ